MSLKQVNKWINSIPWVKSLDVIVKVKEYSIGVTAKDKNNPQCHYKVADTIIYMADGARDYDRWLNEKERISKTR